METLEKLLHLPYQTFAILVAGYLSYRLAYTGRDANHKTLDTLAIPLVFAFVAQASSAGLLFVLGWDYLASIGGIFAALVAAYLWRSASGGLVPDLLRKLNISWSDRYVTAWETVTAREDYRPTQVSVTKKDGTRLECERLADFESMPSGPVIFGRDGSVAMYVTHRTAFGSSEREELKPFDEEQADWGAKITIVPAEEISETHIRLLPPSSRNGSD